MLKPAHIETLHYFYPVGNTPAVCYTQTVPPGKDATILLLGCGDARSVLFTIFAQSSCGMSKHLRHSLMCLQQDASLITHRCKEARYNLLRH